MSPLWFMRLSFSQLQDLALEFGMLFFSQDTSFVYDVQLLIEWCALQGQTRHLHARLLEYHDPHLPLQPELYATP